MPKLKQIECSIELGPRNVRLQEFGARYNDGHVETFIAIPDTDIPFTIHIKTEGYIAPGLAFFAFMDGEYQCNRNRIGLKVPGPGVERAQYEAEFRLRQKEEKTAFGSFVGRGWSFKKLQMADADKAPQLNSRFLNNIGSIEIVALRCTRSDGSKGHPKGIPNLDGSVERCEPSTDGWPATSNISSRIPQVFAMPQETATFGGNLARPGLMSDGVLLENLLDLTPGRCVGEPNIAARLAVNDVLVENASAATETGHPFGVPIHIEESEACAPISNFDGAGDEPQRRKNWNMKSRLLGSRIPATPANKNYVHPAAVAHPTYVPSDAGIRPVGEGVYDGRARYYDFGGYLPDQIQQSAYAQPYETYMSRYGPQIQPYPVGYAPPDFDLGAGQMRQPANSWASLPVGLPMRDNDGVARRKGGPEMNIVPEDPKNFERLLGRRLEKEGGHQDPGYNPNYKRGHNLDDKVENSPSTYEHNLSDKRRNMRPAPQKAKPSPKGKDVKADSGGWAQGGKGTPVQSHKGSWKDQGATGWVGDKNREEKGQKDNWQDPGAAAWAEDKNGKGSARVSKKEWNTSDKQQSQQNEKTSNKDWQTNPAAEDDPWAAIDAANGGWDDAPNNGGGGWKEDTDDKSKKSSGIQKDTTKDSKDTKDGDANAWGSNPWGAEGGENNHANDWGDNNGAGADGNAWEKKSEGISKGRDADRWSQFGNNDNNDNHSNAWPAQSVKSGGKASGSKAGSWVVQSGTAASARSFKPTDPQVLIKPYWKDWTRPFDRLEEAESDAPTLRAEPRPVYQYPEEPLPALPSGKVKGASHAVQAGKGTDYAHLCRRPTYLDTMEAPYAVFSFKYRSKDVLEKILKKRIDDSVVERVKKQVEKDQLLELPKHKLVEQLLAARK